MREQKLNKQITSISMIHVLSFPTRLRGTIDKLEKFERAILSSSEFVTGII